MMLANPLFMHIHIVKNAGTTFESILQMNFGADYVSDTALFFHQYTCEEVGRLIDAQPFMRAYSSHKLSLSLPFDRTDRQVIAIAFVRDPVQRFQSHYEMHARRHARNKDTAPNVAKMSRRDYIGWALEQGNLLGYIDGQLRYLTPECVSTSDAVEQAVKSGQLLLFPVDRFNDACILLENRFPDYFRNCAYSRRNAAPTRLDWTEEEIEIIRQHVGVLDLDLLKRANSWLDLQLGKYVGSADAMHERQDDFQRRCRFLTEPPSVPLPAPPMRIYRRLRTAGYLLRYGRLPG